MDLPPVESYDEADQQGARRPTASAKAPAAGGETRPGNGALAGVCDGEVVHRCLFDIEEKPYRWLWPGRIAKVNLDEALAGASEGVAGITVQVFRSLLSPEDVADIEAGAIHSKTLYAYALSFAEGIRPGALLAPREGAPQRGPLRGD
jgi:hypothetical protein